MTNFINQKLGKRDRWNGVDMDIHQERIRSEFERLDEARRMIKSKNLEENELKKQLLIASQPIREHDSDDEADDEDKYADEMDMPGQKVINSKIFNNIKKYKKHVFCPKLS